MSEPQYVPVTTPPSLSVALAAPSVTAEELRGVAAYLSDTSASRLIERHGQTALSAHAIAETGLATASVGFGTLDPLTLREVGALLNAAYGSLDEGERARLGEYLDRVRSGSAQPEEAHAGLERLNRAVLSLDGAKRGRLVTLFDEALEAGIRHQAEASARTREARPVEVAATEPVATGQRTGVVVARGTASGPRQSTASERSGRPGRGESYWRAEGQRRQDAVARAERELAAAERAGNGFVYGGPDSRDREQVFLAARTAANARIARAQGALEAARRRLSDLDEDARRDSAQPGWTR